MNITEKITKQLKPDHQEIVRNNLEIQMYYNHVMETYVFRDGRFYDSSYEKHFTYDTLMIKALEEHLDNSIDRSKEAIACGDFTLTINCPHCKEEIDLLDTDNGYDQDSEFTQAFFEDWDKLESEVECCHCNKYFTAAIIQR